MSKKDLRILLSDDDPAILDAIRLMLELEEFQVDAVLNGKGILERKTYPDLYILDIWMSGVDGKEICKQLKANPATRAIPVILISASITFDKLAKDSGADAFLAKPFELQSLIHLITKLTQI